MNIYEFINFNPNREYYEKNRYQFDALQSAWLVLHSYTHTIAEKHIAWQEIIATMPDMLIDEEYSLHDILKNYIALENRLLSQFYHEEAYSYYYCIDVSANWFAPPVTAAFKHYQDAISVTKKDFDSCTEVNHKEDEITQYCICKQCISFSDNELECYDNALSVYFDRFGRPLKISEIYDNSLLTNEEYELWHIFDERRIHFPEVPILKVLEP